MDGLADILARKDFDEPQEIAAIKQFIREQFDEDAEVLVREREIIVTLRPSSLANALRLKITALRQAAATDKRVILRVR